MAPIAAESAFSAAALLISASLAVISISSDLFMWDLVEVDGGSGGLNSR
jgi:hypothetical protein